MRNIRLLQLLFCIANLISIFNLKAEEACPIRDLALTELTKVRKLEVKKAIPCKKLSKPEIRSYLESALKKKTTPERLELERRVLLTLKLIPSDYNYQEELLALYSDQVGGYYDPELEYFGTASWIPESMQVPIAFHELTHALQDQHYNLDAFTDSKLSSDDLLARSALAEGDASFAMLLVGRSQSGNPQDLTDTEIKFFSETTIKSSLENKKLAQTPKAIRAQLVFPYSSGIAYVSKLYKNGSWKAINTKYESAPQGTNEVLGFQKEELSEKEKSELTCQSLSKNNEIIYEDTLGALYLGYVLGEDVLMGELKDRWAGDRLCVYSTGDSKNLKWGIRLKKNTNKTDVLAKLYKKFSKESVLTSETGLVIIDTSLD